MTRKPYAVVADEITRFAASDTILLTPAFMRRYENRWVASYAGGVVAVSDNMHDLFKSLAEIGAPLRSTAVRYIGKDGLSA